MRIRNDIRQTLAAKLDDAQLAMQPSTSAVKFDEEIDKARRAEGQRGGGGESGGGGS